MQRHQAHAEQAKKDGNRRRRHCHRLRTGVSNGAADAAGIQATYAALQDGQDVAVAIRAVHPLRAAHELLLTPELIATSGEAVPC
ncbi:MAG TPA: hypothetical protein VEZ89_12795 [Rubrivivax sp.]|nr:hypothetical protein [Rubrivivax sp.]